MTDQLTTMRQNIQNKIDLTKNILEGTKLDNWHKATRHEQQLIEERTRVLQAKQDEVQRKEDYLKELLDELRLYSRQYKAATTPPETWWTWLEDVLISAGKKIGL